MEPASTSRAKIISRATTIAALLMVPMYYFLGLALMFMLEPVVYLFRQVNWPAETLVVVVRPLIVVLVTAWLSFLIARATYRFEQKGHPGVAIFWHVITSVLVVGLIYWTAYYDMLHWLAAYKIYPRDLLGQVVLALPAGLIIWATGGIERQKGSMWGAWLGSALGFWLYFSFLHSSYRASEPVPCCLVRSVPQPELLLLFIVLGLAGYYLTALAMQKRRRSNLPVGGDFDRMNPAK